MLKFLIFANLHFLLMVSMPMNGMNGGNFDSSGLPHTYDINLQAPARWETPPLYPNPANFYPQSRLVQTPMDIARPSVHQNGRIVSTPAFLASTTHYNIDNRNSLLPSSEEIEKISLVIKKIQSIVYIRNPDSSAETFRKAVRAIRKCRGLPSHFPGDFPSMPDELLSVAQQDSQSSYWLTELKKLYGGESLLNMYQVLLCVYDELTSPCTATRSLTYAGSLGSFGSLTALNHAEVPQIVSPSVNPVVNTDDANESKQLVEELKQVIGLNQLTSVEETIKQTAYVMHHIMGLEPLHPDLKPEIPPGIRADDYQTLKSLRMRFWASKLQAIYQVPNYRLTVGEILKLSLADIRAYQNSLQPTPPVVVPSQLALENEKSEQQKEQQKRVAQKARLLRAVLEIHQNLDICGILRVAVNKISALRNSALYDISVNAEVEQIVGDKKRYLEFHFWRKRIVSLYQQQLLSSNSKNLFEDALELAIHEIQEAKITALHVKIPNLIFTELTDNDFNDDDLDLRNSGIVDN